MKRRYGLLAIIVSLLIHAILYCGLPTVHEKTETPVIIDLVVAPEPAIQRSAPRKQMQVGSRKRLNYSGGPPQVTRQRLDSIFRPDFAESVRGDVAASSEKNELPFYEAESYGISGESYDAGNAVRGFTEALYNKINNRLIFDSILAQYNHFGTVYVEFRVNRKGLLIENSLRLQSTDRILQVHVLRSALIPALSKELPQNLWPEEDVKLRARFQFFQSTTQSTLFDSDPEKIAGTALTFRRFTVERRVARNLGQHLMNGGINVDLFAMYEAWGKYEKAQERSRLDVDPFSVYRADPYYDF